MSHAGRFISACAAHESNRCLRNRAGGRATACDRAAERARQGALFRQRPLLLLLVIMSATVAFLGGTSNGHAQESTAKAADWHFRYELFQMLLEQNGTAPVAPDKIMSEPRDSLIVLMGNVSVFEPPELQTFCENGGAVLLATDLRSSVGRIGEFEAPSSPVTGRDANDWYRNYNDCLTIRDLSPDNPLVANVKELVVNRSGWLARPRWARSTWDVVARLPAAVDPSRAARQPVIASVRVSGNNGGKLLMVADPSLLTNGMLWHGDNALFAINASRILCEGGRSRLLFVVDRNVQGSYRDSPLVNQNLPPLPNELPDNLPEPVLATWLRFGNSIIRNVEESNLLNEIVANHSARIREPLYNRSILFTLAAVALLFIIRILTASNATTHPAMPDREMQSAHALAAAQKAESAEFGLAASMLARELCREFTGSSDPAVWQRKLSGNAVSGNPSLQRKSAGKDIRKVLELAVNTRTVHISRRKFAAAGRMIQKLRELHREGLLFSA